MKKLFAIILALTVIMSLSITAFAADANITGYPEKTIANGGTFTLTKQLSVKNTGTLFPANALTFTIANGNAYGDSAETVAITNPTGATVSLASYTEGATSANLTVQLPTYTEPGVYYYTISETSTAAGVEIATSELPLKVTVIQDPASEEANLVVAGVALRVDNEKVDEIDNTFNAGQLTVTKEITGNLADLTSTWEIVVEFTKPSDKDIKSTVSYTVAGGAAQNLTFGDNGKATATVTLGNGDSAVFTNIPYGVTYTVVETAANSAGYTTTGEVKTATAISGEKATVTITNNKEIEVDTGITLDSIPYILLLVAVAAVVVVMFIRKRRTVED